jgi:hypothetical protein
MLSLLQNVQIGWGGASQPPTQCAPGALSPALKRPWCEEDHRLYSMSELNPVDLYLHHPIRLHGLHGDNFTFIGTNRRGGGVLSDAFNCDNIQHMS